MKYSLLLCVILITHNNIISQKCVAVPNFILNGSAQQSEHCSTCSYHNYNEPGVIFGDEFDNRSFFNTDEDYLGLQWETPISNAVSIQNCLPVGLSNQHLFFGGLPGAFIETKDIDISIFREIKVSFSYHSLR